MKIKRSIPATLSILCESSDYAQGVKDGIMYTLECLLHECDVIIRVSPYVEKLTVEIPDNDTIQQYRVRARFTARSKLDGREKGNWIKTDHAYYEEEIDNRFDIDREWKSLTDEELHALHFELKVQTMGGMNTLGMYRILEAKLKEKNHAA